MIKIHNIEQLTDVVVAGKVVIVRADLNVPIINGQVLDLSRLKSIVPTINYLRANGAKIILLSHFGRPKGKNVPELSLKNLQEYVSRVYGTTVHFVDEIKSENISRIIQEMDFGDIAMMENLRFYNEEEINDKEFAKTLSSFGNVYVNEAFSCSHRKHASIEAITHFIRSVAGFSFLQEIQQITKFISGNKNKLLTIVGGSKVASKIDVLSSLVRKSNTLFLGGGIANSILAKKGYNIGQSIFEKDIDEQIDFLYSVAEKSKCKIILPLDVVVESLTEQNGERIVKNIQDVSNEDRIVDIGDFTISLVEQEISKHDSVFMNAPVGLYEKKPFDFASMKIVHAVADATKSGQIHSMAGGGDIVACINMAKRYSDFSMISNAGGAFLEFIAEYQLPGIVALQESAERY